MSYNINICMDTRLSSVTVYMSSFQQDSNEKRAVDSTYPQSGGLCTKNSSHVARDNTGLG